MRRGLLLGLLAGIACRSEAADTQVVGAPPSALGSPSAGPSASASGAAAPRRPPACRVIGVQGQVERLEGSVPVEVGQALDDTPALRLAPLATLSYEHTASGRQLRLEGPAVGLPCRHGEERLLLTSGKLTVLAAARGSSPPRAYVATPLGTLHWVSAQLTLEATAGRVHAEVSAGEAWFRPLPTVRPSGALRLAPPSGSLSARGNPSAEAALTGCEASAEIAHRAFQAVLAPASPGLPSVAERASKNLEARQHALATCLAASLYVTPEQPEFQERLRRAELRWRRPGRPDLYEAAGTTPSASRPVPSRSATK